MVGPRLVFDGRNCVDPATVRAAGGDYVASGAASAPTERSDSMTKLIIQIPCYNEEETLADRAHRTSA